MPASASALSVISLIGQAHALGERGEVDAGELGRGGAAVDRFLEHLHVVIGAVVEHEELDRQAGAGGGGQSRCADIKKQPSPVTQTTCRSGRHALGADRRGNRPAHALVVRPA